MDEAMEALLRASNQLCSGDRGMPSVGVNYDPYACKWVARADYSDGHRVEEIDDDAGVAVARLTERLMQLTPSSAGA